MKKNYKLNKVRMINSIKELLEIAGNEAGNKTAFKYKSENNKEEIVNVTYNEFIRETNEIGTALAKYNVHNKHIAIIGENSYKWLVVYLTVLKSTGVFVPIDKELPLEGVINILNHSESEVLFYSKKYEKWIDEIKTKVPNIKYFIGLNKKDNASEKNLSYDKFREIGSKELDSDNLEYIN